MPQVFHLTVRLLIALSLILAPVSGAFGMASMAGAGPQTMEHCGAKRAGADQVATHQSAPGVTHQDADDQQPSVACELCSYCGHCLAASVSSPNIGPYPAHFPAPGFLPTRPHEHLSLVALRPPDSA